jgi:hypothetical protein
LHQCKQAGRNQGKDRADIGNESKNGSEDAQQQRQLDAKQPKSDRCQRLQCKHGRNFCEKPRLKGRSNVVEYFFGAGASGLRSKPNQAVNIRTRTYCQKNAKYEENQEASKCSECWGEYCGYIAADIGAIRSYFFKRLFMLKQLSGPFLFGNLLPDMIECFRNALQQPVDLRGYLRSDGPDASRDN